MALIDFILNLAAASLWLSWLSIRFDPLVKTSAASLVGTLRKASPYVPKRWTYLASLGLLLLFRALVCWQICTPLRLTPFLHLGIINLPFRSDSLLRMLVFSLLSFALVLMGFYLWLLLISVANFHVADTEPFQKMTRLYLKWVERAPRFLKLLAPFLLGAACWLAFHPLLVWLRIVPPSKSIAQMLEQAALIGAAAYLIWKYLIVGVLLLHLLNSYVYLGSHAFWSFINTTARNLLHPLRWLPLRLGKVDFLPVAVIAAVFLLAEALSRLRLPF
jgi:uncharacterized protein YggT (Ycf19 family)